MLRHGACGARSVFKVQDAAGTEVCFSLCPWGQADSSDRYTTHKCLQKRTIRAATVAVAWEQNREKETTKMDASEQKLGSRLLKAWKRIVIVLAVAASILAAVFLAIRYGWKLLGFRACQGAGIDRHLLRHRGLGAALCPLLGRKGLVQNGGVRKYERENIFDTIGQNPLLGASDFTGRGNVGVSARSDSGSSVV